jgi:hypothetical protein
LESVQEENKELTLVSISNTGIPQMFYDILMVAMVHALQMTSRWMCKARLDAKSFMNQA